MRMRRRHLPLPLPLPQGNGAVVLLDSRGLGRLQGNSNDEEQYYYHYYVPDDEHQNRGILYWIRRTILLCLQTILLAVLSTVSYAALYHYHQPRLVLQREVYFDYFHQPADTAPTIAHPTTRRFRWAKRLARLFHAKEEQKQQQQQRDQMEVTTASLPSAFLSFDDGDVLWATDAARIRNTTTATATSTLQSSSSSSSQQRYYVEVLLQLPESTANLQAGMWELRLELFFKGTTDHDDGTDSTTTTASRRSLHFPYRTPWVRTVRNLATVLPLLLQMLDESQWMRVPLFRQFVVPPHAPITAARITCGAPEITAAYLVIGQEWSAVYTILRTWFWMSAVVGTTAFATVYVLVWNGVAICCGGGPRRRHDDGFDFYDSPSLNDGSLFVEEVLSPEETQNSDANDHTDFVDAHMHEPTTAAAARETTIPSQQQTNDDFPVHIPRQPAEFADDGSEYWEDLSLGSLTS